MKHALQALWAIVLRELLKFGRQYGRLLSAIVRPLLWLAVFAAGFRNVFGVAIVEPYDTYIPYDVYIVPGLIGMVLLFNGMQSSLAMVYDPGIAEAFRKTPLVADVDLWAMYDAISCPTLVIRGAESDLLLHKTAQEMSRRGPKASLIEFEGIGHAPMLLDGRQIEAVSQFLLADPGN